MIRTTTSLAMSKCSVPCVFMTLQKSRRTKVLTTKGPNDKGFLGSCLRSACPSKRALHNRANLKREISASTLFKKKNSSQSDPEDRWWEKNSSLFITVESAKEFDDVIREAGSSTVVIDFYTRWCKSCKGLYPTLCKLAEEREDIVFVKVSGDGNRALLKRQGVVGFPYFQIYRDHELLTEFHAVPSKKQLLVDNIEFVANQPWEVEFKLEKGRVTVARPSVIQSTEIPDTFDQLSQGDILFSADEDDDLYEGFDSDDEYDGDNAKAFLKRERLEAEVPGERTFDQPAWSPAAAEKINFLAKYGDQYGYGGYLDEIYDMEVGERMRMNDVQHHYLDYTGASIYTTSQLKSVFKDLERHVYGNPHSANPSSALTGEEVEDARDLILEFFQAPPGEYKVIFTRNATAALKLLGETFPWEEDKSEFLYLRENHNSVLGIREYAHLHNTKFQSISEDKVNAWLAEPDEIDFEDMESNEDSDFEWAAQDDSGEEYTPESTSVSWSSVGSEDTEAVAEDSDDAWWTEADAAAAAEAMVDDNHYSLFAFPAEDNFSGVKHNLEWIQKVQQRSKGYITGQPTKWKVLLDAAAYAPTQPLNLSETSADFVCLSFYKIFGYPTGLGALIMKTENNDILNKVFWGGGSVKVASSDTDFHLMQCEPSSKLEDGTVAFLDILSLKHGFNAMSRLGGIERIQAHVRALTDYAYDSLSALKHSTGQPLLHIFGKHHLPNRHDVQGGILNFNVLDKNGDPIGYTRIQKESADVGFHIRTGSSCNPGSCYSNLQILPAEIEQMADYKESCGDDTEWMFVQRGSYEGHPLNENGQHPIIVSSEEEISDAMEVIKESKIELGHEGEIALHWEKVPLGTVRMSLGWMSTFEDVYEFVQWIEKYIDEEV